MTHIWNRVVTGLSLTLGLAASGSSASAAFIEGTFDGAGQGGFPSGTVTINYQGNVYQTNTGHFQFTRTGGSSLVQYPDLNDAFRSPASGNTFWAFCIELDQGFANPISYDVAALTSAPIPGTGSGQMTAGQALALRALWGRYYADVDTNDEAAAFQLAIWEIVGDLDSQWAANGASTRTPGYDFMASDDLKYTDNNAAIKLQANLWLNSLDGTGELGNLRALVSLLNQDLIIEVEDGFEDLDLVPAPPALVLAVVGVLPCLALRRRLRARAV